MLIRTVRVRASRHPKIQLQDLFGRQGHERVKASWQEQIKGFLQPFEPR